MTIRQDNFSLSSPCRVLDVENYEGREDEDAFVDVPRSSFLARFREKDRVNDDERRTVAFEVEVEIQEL